MGSAVPDFMEEPFEIEIREERGRGPIGYLSWPNGLRRATPYDVLLEEYRRVGEAINRFEKGRPRVLPAETQTTVRH